jgi:cellulose synthase/poly-beta-1,6-N-acetylglucosamine synthase-like glycosyltransferase
MDFGLRCLAYGMVLYGMVYTFICIWLFVLAYRQHLRRENLSVVDDLSLEFQAYPSVSMILTAYNEEVSIETVVRSLMHMPIPDFEIIVVNDGSKDRTLDILIEKFELKKRGLPYRRFIPTTEVIATYESDSFPRVLALNKLNGGCKADASNAGINLASKDCICALDADTIVDRGALRLLLKELQEYPEMIGVGGNVKAVNSCLVRNGAIVQQRVPWQPLVLSQVLEYTRAFMVGRVGWSAMRALPLISGAFGVFRRKSVIELGGFRKSALGEDMDLVLRFYKHYSEMGKTCHLGFVPEAICWTEVPESLKVLRRQRVRWHRGLLECLSWYRTLIFKRHTGALGAIAMPFQVMYEALSPIMEVVGYGLVILMMVRGIMTWKTLALFFFASMTLGINLSFLAVFLEMRFSPTRLPLMDILKLILGAVFECIGIRQLQVFWRWEGMIRWMFKSKSTWGTMTRKGFTTS